MEISDLSCLAIIPARRGSKGILNKNIIDCAGKPLIAWTVEAALNARYIKDTIVSTDCPEIAKTAACYGADAPFLRKKELAGDNASVVDVVSDVLNRIPSAQRQYDLIVLLQPTSPLRTHKHIDWALSKYARDCSSELDTLFSATQVDSKVLWTFHVDEMSNYVRPVLKDLFDNPRRQELPKCYSPNGAIYVAPAATFSGFFSDRNLVFEMSEDASVDIDSPEDLRKAENYLLGQA